MRYFGADRSHECTWNRESGRDPTIGVYDMNRNIVVINTLNRIADILIQVNKQSTLLIKNHSTIDSFYTSYLSCSHKYGKSNEQHSSENVM